MQFDSMSALLSMDGHGIFVWSVYGLALLVLVLLTVAPLRKQRRFFIEELMRQRRQQASGNEQRTYSNDPRSDELHSNGQN